MGFFFVMDKVQKKLVFSVLQYLNGISESAPEGVDVESLEVAVQCLGQAFSIDVTDEEQKKDLEISASLDQLFKYGLALDTADDTPITRILKQAVDTVGKAKDQTPPKTEDERIFDEKFQKYIATLTEKGYFQGTEEGSDEYNQRLQKAKDRLIAEEEKALEARKEQAEIKKAEGNTFLRESKIQEAISSYSEAIKLYPKNAIYYANRAAAYTTLRDHEAAIEDCIAAVKIDPTYSKAFSRLGLAYFSLGRYHEAVHSYERAVELDPTNETIAQSLEIARKKDAEKLAAEGDDGRTCQHGQRGATGGHGHAHAGNQPAAGGMPDFSSLMNNPGIQNMVNSMQSGGGMPNISEMLNNPDIMSQATQLLNNPGVGNLLNNPAVMNMASQFMSNPDMMSSMMRNFGGMGGQNNGGDKKQD